MLLLGHEATRRLQFAMFACCVPARPPTKSFSQPPALTGGQIRAARALIRWSAEELAKESALGVATIRRAELRSATRLTAANDLAVRRALEAAGVEFIDASEKEGPGAEAKNEVGRLG
jgi:hypothetical protein